MHDKAGFDADDILLALMLVLMMRFDDVGVDDTGVDDAVAGAADHAVVDALMLVLLVSFGLLV